MHPKVKPISESYCFHDAILNDIQIFLNTDVGSIKNIKIVISLLKDKQNKESTLDWIILDQFSLKSETEVLHLEIKSK